MWGLKEGYEIKGARLNTKFKHVLNVMGVDKPSLFEQNFLGVRVQYIC